MFIFFLIKQKYKIISLDAIYSTSNNVVAVCRPDKILLLTAKLYYIVKFKF